MFTAAVSFCATVALALLFLGGAPTLRRLVGASSRMIAVGGRLVAMALAGLLLASTARAFELRTEEKFASVREGEVITDSALVAAAQVVVDGVIDGDLFAFGEDITIKGEVRGDLYTAGETVTITGQVTGNAHAAGQTLALTGARLGQNAYLAAQRVTLDKGAAVARDLHVLGERVAVAGTVGRSAHVRARHTEIEGRIERDLVAHAQRVTVGGGGYIGGDLRATVPEESAVDVNAGATLAGKRNIELDETAGKDVEEAFVQPSSFGGTLVCLVGAFLAGLLVILLAPAAVPAPPDGSGSILRRMGVGFLTLVATPVAVLFIALTVVGIPVALTIAAAFGLACYLAHIVVAYFIGRKLLRPQKDRPGRLQLGSPSAW